MVNNPGFTFITCGNELTTTEVNPLIPIHVYGEKSNRQFKNGFQKKNCQKSSSLLVYVNVYWLMAFIDV